jgi:hypothetical protein
MTSSNQFSLWYLLVQLSWLALALGAFRLLPTWPPGVGVYQLERFLFVRWALMSCIGFAAGAMIGGLQQRTIRGGIMGLGGTAVVVGVWNLYVWARVIASV